MSNVEAPDPQLRLLRLVLAIVGAVLGIIGWYRWAT
jgi:hypothetical protein